MISRVLIRNFQSIRELDLPLARVTAVTGDTDAGKSALIRAFYCLAFNRATDGYLHKGKGPLEVEIHTDDGHKLKLVRPKGKTPFYVLDGVLHDKIGRDVPDEVAAILRLRKFTLDKDVEILPSIQRQLDPQFLLQSSDTVVSKTIGRISNISIVFAALRKASADAIDLATKLSTVKAQLLQNEQDLATLEGLDERHALATALLLARGTLRTAEARHRQARGLAAHLADIGKSLARAEAADTIQETLLLAAATNLDASRRLARANNLRIALRDTAARLRQEEARQQVADALRAALGLKDAKLKRLHQAVQLRNILESLRARHNLMRKDLLADTNQLECQDKDLEQALANFRVCPLIQAPFKEGCRDRLHQLARPRKETAS